MTDEVFKDIKQIRWERYQSLEWTDAEKLLRNRHKYVRDIFKGKKLPFTNVAAIKLKRSVFGPFLKHFNEQQVQDYEFNDSKLATYKFYKDTTFDAEDRLMYGCNNDFIEDIEGLLAKAVDEREVVDFEFLYKNIVALRIMNTSLTILDSDLRNFKNLKVLILTGNLLTEVHGNCLPRKLEYLELYGNHINTLKNFDHNGPKHLKQLGLGRNWLTDGSRIHLLGSVERYKYVKCLDLADNDIADLVKVLEALKYIPDLYALQLEGNPCAVLSTYKTDVLHYFPRLIFLDNTKLSESDKLDSANLPDNVEAAIIFTCHRITGLPPVKKEVWITLSLCRTKGAVQTFHFEVSMPLLEEVILEYECLFEDSVTDPVGQKKGAGKKSKTSPYDAPDEYAAERRDRVMSTSFRTERFPWAKIIQLPDEALVIESYDGNLTDIRDTFRSRVNVKLIYLKIALPEKERKGGKGKKKGAKGKKSKGSKDGRNLKVTDGEALKPPKERILKKVTIANFWCDLHSINWSDKTIDFFWGDHPKAGKQATEMEGSLRACNYGAGGGKNKKKGKQKDKKKEKKKKDDTSDESKKDGRSSDDSKSSASGEKIPVPKYLTCQVGFGLKRSYEI